MEGAYWRDIGTPNEYRLATRDVLEGRVRLFGGARAGCPPTRRSATTCASRVTCASVRARRIGDGVRVIGPSVIGDGVVIGAGATIENSIVWDGARIGKGARVIDSVVGLDFEIPAGVSVEGAIVANEPAKVH
jgi:mannose-1-phosphate guanylyltransferase